MRLHPPTVHVDLTGWLAAITRAAAHAWDRVRANVWPILQGTGAATISWVIARHLLDHHQPFFAPIAAVVALNASRGERGSNAVRLLLGVIVGVVVAGVAVVFLGTGYVALAVSTFVAMLLALVLGGERIVIAQAAASAILVVATGNTQTGPGRLVDALIGAGVALVMSQLVFPVEPIALLRRAETAALVNMAEALAMTASAAESADDELTGRAIGQLRSLRDELTELSRTRTRSMSAAKRSPRWWGRTSPIVRETENAGQLDLLGSSCLMLTRALSDTDTDDRQRLAPIIRTLADTLAALAAAAGDRHTRQDAADHALAAATQLPHVKGVGSDRLVTAQSAIRAVATDMMVFAGVDPDSAADAVKQGTAQLPVADPPSRPRMPFRPRRRRGNR